MRENNYKYRLSVLISLLVPVLFAIVCPCEAIRLNGNGGYDIVIGVEPNTIEPANVNYFLDEIRVGIDSFSNELWKATNKRFFINSVDVVVPQNWWTLSNFERATWQTLENSEIRITADVPGPNVVNPNPCGSPGLYVELPDNFFKTAEGNDQYGKIGKALVNLWARYRFGVWEEHGIPGDDKFPYFHIHPSFNPKWEATGCSNEELSGSFRTIDSEEAERCDPHQPTMPEHDCRFFPDSENTANASLLSYHYWQDSVVEFCDSQTHNHAAPNRHNLFCSHNSVWEVIRESEDYKSTKTCIESVQRPEFRVMKASFSPQFYVLLDRGRTVTPRKVLQEIMGAMVKFVGYPTLVEKINIAVGTYPHANLGKNHYYVKEEIGWSPISSVLYELQQVFDESSDPDGPVIRDFGLAIKEVAEKIKQRDHEAGTVLLVIKRGAGPNTFDKLTYEQEVISSIKEDSRIQVFVIEAQQGADLPYTNLQTLSQETSGKYHLINDTMNTARKMQWLLDDIQTILEQPTIMNSKSIWVTQKQFTKPDEIIPIPIYDDATLVKVYLTTTSQFSGSKIMLKPPSGEFEFVIGSEKGEWDENFDLSRRTVHTYPIINPTQGSEWELSYSCESEDPLDCMFFLLVTAETDRPLPRKIGGSFSSKFISIDVSTSAENNYLDMSQPGCKIVPFSIFAKVEMQEQRVLRLENVTALIRLNGKPDKNWVILLKDDGSGLPDVSRNDGMYSAVFTPSEDGLYQISVTASGLSEVGVSRFQDATLVNHAGALISKNQLNFGCKNSSKPRCISAVPRGSFSRVQDMVTTVAVENSNTFKPGKPMKILDFTVTVLPDYHVEFSFTSPKLLGSEESPDEFKIYMAPHVDNFIDSTEMTKLLVQERGKPSGTKVTLPYDALSSEIPFYAVEAIYGEQRGGPSNVVGVATSNLGPILPTPRPTTTLPPEPTTTTEFPSTMETTTPNPFSTTTEDYEITEPELSTTTEPQSTTTGSPSSSSTTEEPTSTEPPISSTTDSSSSDITETSSSTTESTSTTTETPIPSSSTQFPEITDTEIPSTSTTELPEATSTSTPTPTPSTTNDPEITEILTESFPSSSSTTPEPQPSSTTDTTDPTGPTSTTAATTEIPVITEKEDDDGPTSSPPLSTSLPPITTTEEATFPTSENFPSTTDSITESSSDQPPTTPEPTSSSLSTSFDQENTSPTTSSSIKLLSTKISIFSLSSLFLYYYVFFIYIV